MPSLTFASLPPLIGRAAVGVLAFAALAPSLAAAEPVVRAERNLIDGGFRFESVPAPAGNDAAAGARFALVDGEADPRGGGLDRLHDGRVPTSEDQPASNFFFRAGSDGGRLLIDLGREIAVRQIASFSWHAGARGPQVYALYAADGQARGFVSAPRRPADPAACGWTPVARVDTRPEDESGGGQYGVAVGARDGVLGTFRYVLLDVRPSERTDAFGNTFFSEIDVVDANGPQPPASVPPPFPRVQLRFGTADGLCRFTVDTTAAPDLAEWSGRALKPLALAWYPRLAALLPSPNFRPPRELAFVFRENMGGTPAAASGQIINLNVAWVRREQRREACGAVVHEMAHVVQDYGRARRTNPSPAPTPGWVTEGIADYVRWFLYEPQTGGARLTPNRLAQARYDASYRVTANFLDWATRTYDRDLVRKLNAAAREGCYDAALWRTWTGQDLAQLNEAWRASETKQPPF